MNKISITLLPDQDSSCGATKSIFVEANGILVGKVRLRLSHADVLLVDDWQWNRDFAPDVGWPWEEGSSCDVPTLMASIAEAIKEQLLSAHPGATILSQDKITVPQCGASITY